MLNRYEPLKPTMTNVPMTSVIDKLIKKHDVFSLGEIVLSPGTGSKRTRSGIPYFTKTTSSELG